MSLKEYQGQNIKIVFAEEGITKVIRGRLVSVDDCFLEVLTPNGVRFWVNPKDVIKIGMEPNQGGEYRGR